MTYMANTRSSGETRGSRGQVARNLLQEARRVKARIQMQEECEVVTLKQASSLISQDLQDFIIEKFLVRVKEWDDVLVELEKYVKEEEELERKEALRVVETEEMARMMRETIKEALNEERDRRRAESGHRYNYRSRGTGRECFVCGGLGHIARFCKQRKVAPEQDPTIRRNKNFDSLRLYGQEDLKLEGEKEFDKKRFRSSMDFEKMIRRFPEVLSTSSRRIEYMTGETCYIRTIKGAKVVRRGQIVPQSLREKTRNYFKDLENRGIIRRSRSDWRNPIRAIEKPNGDVRVVSNLMGLNDLVEKDPYSLPTIREIIQKTQGSNVFTVIDLKEGFYHIEIEEKHKHKTAFEFDGLVYEWNSMVMGFKNAPQVMQRTMNRILDEWRGEGVEVYMDDIVIHAKECSRHDELFIKVMQRFKETGLRVNPQKIQFRKSEVELLGVTIDGFNRKPSEITRNEALEYRRPECVKDLRRFLGLAGWFREFIKNFALITVSLTEALKSDRRWKWTEEMEDEFKLIKEELRNMRSLKIPDYKKTFRLRTDASDTGLGAVLLQTNNEGKWVPIQWASKKLTPTERKYTITEKEMLAVVWGVEKFEYELRGRRFELMTDHKALEEIRNKPYFNNNRVNRWIERIQEYDFKVQYVRGELMGDADALSRQFQEEGQKSSSKGKISKQMEGKILKHTIQSGDKQYWRFDDGVQKEIPLIEERGKIIKETHINLNHRGVKGTHYHLKQQYYWPGMKDMVTMILKQCETCQVANRKTKGGVEFVTSSHKGEKVAIDIMEIGEPRVSVLIGIDYYTRYLYGKVIDERTTENIIRVLEEWFGNGDVPEVIISDNAREFSSSKFKKWCSMNEIDHRKVSVEAHGSNGRVERVIRTIRESVFKQGTAETEVAVMNAVEIYNKTYHSGLRCTPIEAVKDCNRDIEIKWENSVDGDYAKNFIKRSREKFTVGQPVRMAKRENLGIKSKRDSGRFVRRGTITDICDKDSYIVKTEDGHLIKKRHYDLKGLSISETNRLEEGMLGMEPLINK